MAEPRNLLITVCARGGSKGVPGKNLREVAGRSLLGRAVDLARAWGGTADPVVVSTDSPAIRDAALALGATVPFLRPEELARDDSPKLPVLTHALREAERHFGREFAAVLDLDPTSPLRTESDLDRGWAAFRAARADVCFSVVKARKNPYFNMVERDPAGAIHLVKALAHAPTSRQAAPQVWELNASIYFYRREFLLSGPRTLWEGRTELFEMDPISAFDIDEERDLHVVEALLARQPTQSRG